MSLPNPTPTNGSMETPPPNNRTRDWNIWVGVLTFLMVSGFMTTMVMLFKISVPDGNKDTLFFMAGQLSVFTGMCIGYWVQSTAQSKAKTDMIANRKQGS